MMSDDGAAPQVMSKKIHPFFVAPKDRPKPSIPDVATPPTPDSSCSPGSEKATDETSTPQADRDEPSCRKRKRRKIDTSANSNQSSSRGPKAKRQSRPSTGTSSLCSAAKKDEQTVATGDATDELNQNQPRAPSGDGDDTDTPLKHASTSPNNTDGTTSKGTDNPSLSQKPSKLLKLNPKTGTIGSPPKPKSSPLSIDNADCQPARRRGRKPKDCLISIKYGDGDSLTREEVGEKINKIVADSTKTVLKNAPSTTKSTSSSSASTTLPPLTPKKRTPTKVNTPKKATPRRKKNTHPFFQGKTKPQPCDAEDKPKEVIKPSPKRHTIFTSTPCSPIRARQAPSQFNMPSFSNKDICLKAPGSRHPAWPWRGIAHVRNDEDAHLDMGHMRDFTPLPTYDSLRKAKGNQVIIPDDESIVHSLCSAFSAYQPFNDLRSHNSDDFQPVPPQIRVPTRHFESGKKLQARIHAELLTYGNPGKTHPAINHAYHAIQTSLSAFDRATCETLAWAQKYAPSSAATVLQSGREAFLLRDWLQSLKVQAVDTGVPDGNAKTKAAAPTKKRRRRKKLNDFVVSSGDETEFLEELSDTEVDFSPHTSNSPAKTVVRPRGNDGGRLANSVVLSGPHGCGKTATVYAIAKELDFEVFEINSGARRTGRDVLERIGDMVQNHLVKHHGKEEGQDDTAMEDEVARDLKSGKQGTMMSFFKPNPSKTQKPPKARSAGSIKPTETKKPAKSQKQSLILLEEVDVLFEEDKQFWTTIISLITRSKRPFIMTCNEESFVPLQTLDLHGIFRFSKPPKDLAVDLILLIAASEGHVLRRTAVETLFDSREHDLRASITELNYWCQMGVGDARGGFDWFFPRWPKGSDVDEEGNIIRVVSENTYHAAMGWFNQDPTFEGSSTQSVEEDLHRQLWDGWSFDVHDSKILEDTSVWAKTTTATASSAKDRLDALNSFADFADILSDSDICAAGMSAPREQGQVDPAYPLMPAKVKEDIILGRTLLEASPLTSYDTTSLDISFTLKSKAQALIRNARSDTQDSSPLSPLNEYGATVEIQRHINRQLIPDTNITRVDYSRAFDPIAALDKVLASGYLTPSVFDRTMEMITLDVAPYVRSIVAYDQRLQQERLLRSNLLSEGGKPGKKRMRTTRSAYSALEGGSRARTRKEKYFSADINPYLVLHTGGKDWETIPVHGAEERLPSSNANQGHGDDINMSSE
ncbi:hypothetical protein F4778DRAFT_742015 [Xylariomycetidae sp. FL2044]|nr:hypothetical protein F4778DRAFT_742015 [Xylariomycetidae sp. FL2044]